MEKEFTALVAGHQGIILKVCRMYCRDPDDAGDLFQEIVLQLWKGYPRYNGEAKATTWMYKVALHTAITHFRRRRGMVRYLPFSYRRHDRPDDAPDAAAEQHESLRVAMSHLDKFDKAVLILYLDDKPYREIAEIMGISETYVGVKLNRIKKKLKELIKP